MPDLQAKSPCAGLLPKQAGSLTLSEVVIDQAHSVAPFRGKGALVSQALDMQLPKPQRSVQAGAAELSWFGAGQYLLLGCDVPDALQDCAAVTDQSDAWAAVHLSGAGSDDVLARLVPVDLRQSHFKNGHCLRTSLGHMPCSITRMDEDTIRLMVFRSMAQTMVHEIHDAMNHVASRG